MSEFIFTNEALIRIGVFGGVFCLIACAEWQWPRRVRGVSQRVRWQNNLGLGLLNTVLLRLIFPMAAVGAAAVAAEQGWGLFFFLGWSGGLAIGVAIVLLDFVVYLQHRLMHAIPLLWRVHRMHHADLDLDVTSGLRFHPFEMIISMVIKCSAVILLGAPVLSVVLFEVVLNGMALFNHANLRMTKTVDRWLRWIVVTPDMHRTHHSVLVDERDANFGFNLAWWDYLFVTYRAAPRETHERMVLGLPGMRQISECCHLPSMLAMPFRKTNE